MRSLVFVFVLALIGCDRGEKAPPTPTPPPTPVPAGAPYAVAIVINGWELFMGNDKEVPELPPDDPTMYPGVLIELRNELAKSKFPGSAPAGALGMLVVYADKAVARVPMGPAAKLDAKALGTQKDYYGTTGVELVSAINFAAHELRQVKARRKVMIIIGDGNDTNNDAAKGQLARLKNQFGNDGIEVIAYVYRTKLSGEGNILPALTANVEVFSSSPTLGAQLSRTLESLK